MRIVVLGDTHGRSFWKLVANTEKFDLMIFIGDYWDSFDIPYEAQRENFKEICQFKKDNPEKVVLLLGNHDFHYTPVAATYGERYSGYQKRHPMSIRQELMENRELFQMAYAHEKFLFTHAGVTKTWFRKMREAVDLDYFVEPSVEDAINDAYLFKPSLFVFDGIDSYGDDVTQSPIWVRPQSLNEDAMPYIHVVGHTGMKQLAPDPVDFLNGGQGIFIDTLGTTGEYLIIDDGKTEVGCVTGKKDRIKYPSTDFDSQ